MAGRGDHIKLGPGVVTKSIEEYRGIDPSITPEYPYGLPLDGLHVELVVKRHESRRIDRQLMWKSRTSRGPWHFKVLFISGR